MLKDLRDKLKQSDAIVNSGNIELDRNEMADEVDLPCNYRAGFDFKLLDRDRKLLNEEHVLQKIDLCDFVICEGTGEPILQEKT